MNFTDILKRRLVNQHLSHQTSGEAEDIVKHLGAVQSQDYQGAKWALAQRLVNTSDRALDEAFNEGLFVRTHVLRPTWHFVHPEDIRWMQKLTSPRVKTLLAYYDKQLDIDQSLLNKAKDILVNVLANKTFLNRNELGSILTEKGIVVTGQKLGHIVMHAELDGLICSGPRIGKQFTYALLEERVPKATQFNYEEALAELTKRYFTSHGPATVKDFAWWSGLTTAEVKKGIELIKETLQKNLVEGLEFWFTEPDTVPEIPKHVYLLPNYDEFAIAYKDRDMFFDPSYAKTIDRVHERMFVHMIMREGKIVGMWRKDVKKDIVEVKYKFFETPTQTQLSEFEEAVLRYGTFLGLKTILV